MPTSYVRRITMFVDAIDQPESGSVDWENDDPELSVCIVIGAQPFQTARTFLKELLAIEHPQGVMFG